MTDLVVTRLRVSWLCEGAVRLPPYPGSMVRGLLGHGLKRAVCVMRRDACDGCVLESQCIYARFFEAPARDPLARKRFAHVPPPYVLEFPKPSPRALPERGVFTFHLHFLAPPRAFLPYLVVAMEKAGELGMGRPRTPFRLATVDQEVALGSGRWQAVYRPGQPLDPGPVTALGHAPNRPPRRLAVHLETPLRLKRRGQLVRPESFTLGGFLGAVRSRLDDLAWLYGGAPAVSRPRSVVPVDEAHLRGARLRWLDWGRYSSRQRQEMKLGGLVGRLEVDGEALGEHWPALWLGQWLHAGKQTSMGLGQYRLEVLS